MEKDDFPWSLDSVNPKNRLKYIAGMDISFSEKNKEAACAYLAVLSYPELEVN